MAEQITSNPSRQFPRQFKFGNLSRGKDFSTTKRFRLSDIDTKNRVEILPSEMNTLLFNLNIAHNEDFDFNARIEISKLSDFLIKSLSEKFEITINTMDIHKDFIAVRQILKHDLYELDFKGFFRLKRKSLVLFDAFCFFLHSTPFSIVDISDNVLLNDFTIETLEFLLTEKDTDNKREIRSAIKDYKRNYLLLKKFITESTKDEVYSKLNKYKPKNNDLKKVKDSLLNWINLDFSFAYCYPYEHYTEKKENNEFDVEEEEEYDFTDFIYFKYSTNKDINQEIKSRFSDIYNNYTIRTPCWIINAEKEESYIGKSTKAFERFVIDFINMNELLMKI